MIVEGATPPPMYIIHGNADAVVPIELSTRLCDAYAGVALGTLSTAGGKINCGVDDTNVLYIIEDANHALDIKCFTAELSLEMQAYIDSNPDIPGICPSGSAAGDALVIDAYQKALLWLN